MKIQQGWSPVGAGQQRGVAILVITILLLLVATIGTLMIGRVGVFEQRAVGSDVRNKEVYSAAVGGLEYGVNWFGNNYRDAVNAGTFAFTGGDGGADCPARGATAQPLQDLEHTTLNADTYTHTITYTVKSCADRPEVDGMPMIVEVASQAAAVGDSHINKTVSVEVMFGTVNLLSSTTDPGGLGVFSGPPIMVENCMSGITGSPDIYPGDSGVAVGSTTNSADCLDEGHLDYNGGSEASLEPPRSLWNSVFGPQVTEEDLRELEASDPSRVHFVDSTYPHYTNEQPSFNGNNWHADLGSPTEPVIMYIDDSVGCPGVNGSPTIYGLVYYEQVLDANGDPACTYEGWGGATIYGTVAIEGDITGFNANGEIYGEELDFTGGTGGGGGGDGFDTREVSRYAEIPGSWKDF